MTTPDVQRCGGARRLAIQVLAGRTREQERARRHVGV